MDQETVQKENTLLNKKKARDSSKKNETQFYLEENDPEDQIIDEKTGEAIPQITSSSENKNWINKTRTLIVSSRGVSHQERHLVNNLLSLIPNAKKECKIEKEIAREELTEICFNHSCKYSLYFEHRKRELVLWMFKSPEGPCAKFQVRNIHALNEIKSLLKSIYVHIIH